MTRPDDSRLNRFDDSSVRRVPARTAIAAIALTALLLVIVAGGAVDSATDNISPGIGRDVIDAVGEPTRLVADATPLAELRSDLTGGLSPDSELVGTGFDAAPATGTTPGGPSPVTPDYFDPAALGESAEPAAELETLLVTGDSMSIPVDAELGRRLAEEGVRTTRDPHLGTGISNTDIVDWSKLSATQAREEPDAVVVFIGAGDGFPMAGPDGVEVACCGPEWAAIYANRVRQVMDNFRRDGAARVYWMTVPTPRDAGRARYVRPVNEAIEVAAAPWRSQVQVVDTVPVFTPGNEYRDAIEIDGREQVVRESDGLHLNQAGAAVLADLIEGYLDEDFAR